MIYLDSGDMEMMKYILESATREYSVTQYENDVNLDT